MENNQTLLEQAKQIAPYRSRQKVDITNETIELALAWAKDEITLEQVAHVISERSRSGQYTTYSMLARSLKAAIKKGITI